MLFFVGLGGMGLVALWLEDRRLGESRRRGSRARRGAARLVAVGLVATHLVVAPLLLPFNALAFRLFGEPVTGAILSLPEAAPLAGRELVVVNAPDYLSYVSQAGSVLLLDGHPLPRRVRGLAIGPSAVTARRIDERTLELSMADGFFCGPLGPLFHDPPEPFAEGDSFAVPGMTATILALTRDGAPATVRFRFADVLESPRRSWVKFSNGRFLPFEPPPRGVAVELPPALGPFELPLAGGAAG